MRVLCTGLVTVPTREEQQPRGISQLSVCPSPSRARALPLTAPRALGRTMRAGAQHAVSRRRPSRRRQRRLLALARSCTCATEMHADMPPLALSAWASSAWTSSAWRRGVPRYTRGQLATCESSVAHQEPLLGRRAPPRAPSSCHELLRHAMLSSQCNAPCTVQSNRSAASASNALRLARHSTPCTSAAASNKPIALRLRGRWQPGGHWQPGWQPPKRPISDPSLVVPLSRRRRAQQRRHPRQQRRHPRRSTSR